MSTPDADTMNTFHPPEALAASARVLNAAGPFTPVGVSRSSPTVAEATAWALQHFLVIDELQALADRALAGFSGLPAGAVVHCAAAGITLGVAAAMTGSDPARIAQLPDTQGLRARVVVPRPHLVDYGHPLATDIRLAGAQVQACGEATRCTVADIEAALADEGVACLLLVSSRLTQDPDFDFSAAAEAAHRAGVPLFIDGAAQALRVAELAALRPTGLVLSAQKYLGAPTAGLVVGDAAFVDAVRRQQRGIGRAMKPSKEALVGVLAALHEHSALDMSAWRATQARKVQRVLAALSGTPGLTVSEVPDTTGLPLSRVRIELERGADAARRLAARLKARDPAVWVMEHGLAQGLITLELASLRDEELDLLLAALRDSVG